ncbi:hypothetical protein [Streptomyces sp. NPDC059092]
MERTGSSILGGPLGVAGRRLLDVDLTPAGFAILLGKSAGRF